MILENGQLYHIYNQGNNKQKIFFSRENYLFFLRKIKTHVFPFADILAWCLMPNHFHLMVSVGIRGATSSRAPNANTNAIPNLNKEIGIMLASYTRAINKQEGSSGSLFRKRTKAECITKLNGIEPSFIDTSAGALINVKDAAKQYPQVCFEYIHQNPVKAGMVEQDIDWEFSSARDYAGLRNGTLINKSLAEEYIDLGRIVPKNHSSSNS